MADATTPDAVYSERLRACTLALESLSRRDERLGNVRMGVVLVGVALLYAVFGAPAWPLWSLAVPAGLFLGLIIWHERVASARDLEARKARFYREGLERLRGEWQGRGNPGERFVATVEAHPYALDLDLFGKGSLFERLCRAHTRGGEDRLAEYLLSRAETHVARERQTAVQELTSNVNLREDLFVRAGDVQAKVHPKTLQEWAGRAPVLASNVYLLMFVACALGSVVSVVLWALGFGPLWFVLMTFLVAAVTLPTQKAVNAVYAMQSEPGRELVVLAALLRRLATEPFSAPLLVRTQNALRSSEKQDAAHAIQSLGRLIELADARRNQFFVIPALYLLWAPIFAVLLERWRRRHGPQMTAWLDAISELEALSSLAGFAFESPSYVYPEIVEQGPRYEAVGLAHPLLGDEAVANDVTLGKLQLLLVSGSNMSGKSTLLRSIGSSMVLAYAGAPVRAEKLVLSPLALGATLRIQDSLLHGASRFYAEIQRLKAVVQLLDGPLPVFFLLDEILHGTNSHDRRLGALAVVRSLVERGAVGLVTTHDLALAELVSELGVRAKNVHFEDTLLDGKLHFDYRMREGVVQKSNAIALMRAVGLPVPDAV